MQKVISRSIYKLNIDTFYVYDIPFDRSFLQLSNGIRHVMPSTDRKLELTAKTSMAQPVSQPAVCSNGLRGSVLIGSFLKARNVTLPLTLATDGRKFSVQAWAVCRPTMRDVDKRCCTDTNILSTRYAFQCFTVHFSIQ